jgi:hypothetical protein
MEMTVCSLCIARQNPSDRCESCEGFSRFVPEPSAEKPSILGVEDMQSLSANGKLAVLLWLAQRGIWEMDTCR